jgi:hypothetical protein
MATAKKKITKVALPVVYKEEVTGVTLELTTDEAKVLELILSLVGGSPLTSRRNLADNVLFAVRAAGIGHSNSDDITGSLVFLDAEELAANAAKKAQVVAHSSMFRPDPGLYINDSFRGKYY